MLTWPRPEPGGTAGGALLLTVRWEAMPCGLGEPLKLLTAVLLIVGGYLAYGRNKKPGGSQPA